jgi:hypothetical protein
VDYEALSTKMNMGFEVFMAMKMWIVVIWVVMGCDVVLYMVKTF